MARSLILAWLFALRLLSGVLAQITSTSPTGTGANDPLNGNPAPTATVSLTVSPTTVSTCDTLSIHWTIENDTSDVDITPVYLLYTNEGVPQSGSVITYDPPPNGGIITIIPLSRQVFDWFVFLTEPGYYVITGNVTQGDPLPVIVNSPRFLLQQGDPSCLSSSSGSPTTETSSNASPSQSITPPMTQAHHSNTGAIVGGTVAAAAVLAILALLWLLCRRRRNNAKAIGVLPVGPKSGSGRGHQRKWGNLASIDKLQQGEIPVVMPSNSPYGESAYGRTRSQSVGHAMTDEEGVEKGYVKDTFPVDADLLSEMPTLDSNRASRRYSSDAPSAVLRSGLGGYRGRDVHSTAAPVLTTTTATSRGDDDPFSDAVFLGKGPKRVSALSVPSTARASSRVSDISIRPTPSPIPTPVASAASSQANTMVRNTSATASIGRPSRKPVPQYSDDSFELTSTNKSSPTSHSPLTPHSAKSNTLLGTSASSSRGLSSSPSDMPTHWLQDRAPVANRNIGLAGQSDGPVHYLMPDLPPPSAR